MKSYRNAQTFSSKNSTGFPHLIRVSHVSCCTGRALKEWQTGLIISMHKNLRHTRIIHRNGDFETLFLCALKML